MNMEKIEPDMERNGKDVKRNFIEMKLTPAASTLLTWTIAKRALFRPGLALGASSS